MPDFTILHGCRTIQLTRGLNTLIDEADWEWASQFFWNASGGERRYTWYACRGHKIGNRRIGVMGKTYRLHRELINAPADSKVDHQNGDGLDNRRANLRIATQGQNQQNRRKRKGKSRFKGVWFAGDGTPCASIQIDKKVHRLGRYPSEEDAARAYDRAAREHFGEFACTNADVFGDY